MSRESEKSELAEDQLHQVTGGVRDAQADVGEPSSSGQPPVQVSGQKIGSFASKGPVDPDQVKP